MSREVGEGMWVGRPKLILASTSPRRRELLGRVGALEDVRPPRAEEPWDESLDPSEGAVALSRAKAESVAEALSEGIVLGVDTIVVVDDQVLGKPISSDDAKDMLRLLAGRSHEVVSGITLIDTESGRSLSARATTRVTFRSLSEAEMDAYAATGEPLDKAGAYGVQGYGGLFVEAIDGCYYNVVGLPLALLVKTLDTLLAK